MASLTKKPHSKYWFACFRDLGGRQRRRSTGETNEKKALQVAQDYERIAQRKLKPHKARATLSELYREVYGEDLQTATVRQYIDDWLGVKEPETKGTTYASYRKSTAKFLAYLGPDAERDIAEMRPAHIAGFRNSLAKKVAPGTANFDLACIKMVFKAARRDGFIFDDPAEFVKSVTGEKESKRRPFKVKEIQAILSVANSEWQSLIKFGLYTGQRLSDIASLTWANLDTEKNQIRLVTRKTGKTMLLPIAAPLRSHISVLKGSDDTKAPVHPKAFATLQRQKGKTSNLSNQFADLLADAGLREPTDHAGKDKGRGLNSRRTLNELSFHSLRHTAVSLLKDAGIPEAVVMELVGHDSKQMSAHYTHVGQEALEKAAAALPEV
jgi:integrase